MTETVLVTGGSSNIGWACASRFTADYQVVVADLRPPEGSPPDGITFVPCDVTDANACREAVSRAEEFGTLRAVVQSAGITTSPKSVEATDPDEWRRVLDVNLTGAFLMAQASIPALRRSRGSMVMIASRAARVGYAALNPSPTDGTKAHYCASKAGLLSLVRSLAIELAPDSVRVNAVVPGSIEGAMIPRERWPELASRIPLGRLGTPREIAEVVEFLCSDGARYVTGQGLDVNGGTWMN
ncbi:SDR family NAD(P)-dependent oxidoreductase [Prauserella flavalba]|uniref:SDR family NAD(P)-dependent oxidoreductase n=1 Tax=Prauserella flavalba TaxID=1477506 RepID=UPI0036EA2FB4